MNNINLMDTQQHHNQRLHTLMTHGSVIPVITITEEKHALPLAQALINGGLRVLEVTLRSPIALDAITSMRKIDDAIVGAGTILTPLDLKKAKDAGAMFAVSPGYDARLLDEALAIDLPLLCGVTTASEVMSAINRDVGVAKFFPASAFGGIETLKSFGAPFPQIKFCPTGGITREKAPQFLQLDNVLCVGCSWVTPPALVNQNDWESIENLAYAACHITQVND